MSMRGSQGNFPLDDLTYDMVTLLYEKSKGLEAYDKYMRDAQSSPPCAQLLQQLRQQDEDAVRQLQDHLKQLLNGTMGGGSSMGTMHSSSSMGGTGGMHRGVGGSTMDTDMDTMRGLGTSNTDMGSTRGFGTSDSDMDTRRGFGTRDSDMDTRRGYDRNDTDMGSTRGYDQNDTDFDRRRGNM